MNKFFGIILFSLFVLAIGCKSDSTQSAGDNADRKTVYKDQAIVLLSADPQGLHPHCTSGSMSTRVKRNMFHRLLEYDHTTLKLVPLLAKTLPTQSKQTVNGKEGMVIEYELKEGAKWDDGSPVTAKDVEFSFKACRNSKVDASSIRPYIEFIEDIELDPNNPRKIKLLCNKVYFLWDHVTGTDVIISPKNFYDPEGLSDKFTYAQIASGDKKILESADNMAFAKHYNQISFHRDNVNGSGPYKFAGWETGKQIKLERKENWWGRSICERGNVL